MSNENRQIVRRVLDEMFAKGNLDAADELIHPDSSITRRRREARRVRRD